MIENILGPVIDIHGGGQDLVRSSATLDVAFCFLHMSADWLRVADCLGWRRGLQIGFGEN